MREIIMCILLAILFYALIMQCVENALLCFRDEDEEDKLHEHKNKPAPFRSGTDENVYGSFNNIIAKKQGAVNTPNENFSEAEGKP